MHERSLARVLLKQVAEIVSGHSSTQVVAIRISIGRFSGVEPELFQSALKEMLARSPHREAVVEMDIVEIEAVCPECDLRFRVDGFSFTCPECGCQRTRVVQGEGLVLDSILLQEESSCSTTN